MSGYVTDPSIVVNFNNFELLAQREAFISFPSRVRVKSCSFTINAEARGQVLDARNWKMYYLLGHPQPSVGDEFCESTWPMADNQKPEIIVPAQSFVSTTTISESYPVEIPNDKHMNADINFGVMEPGDYMYVWLETGAGNFTEINWLNTNATINISYEATTLPSIRETTDKYPFLD